MKTIESLGDLAGKRVLVRSDFNVPLDAEKNITDDGRIQAALPTLRLLLDAGAKVIIVAHLGRPKGKVNPDYSLAPVAERLREVTGVEVTLAPDTVGEGARAAVAALKPGNIVLLENVRFNAAETSKDDAERAAFAAELASLADVFVSDGFGVVHRKQASVYDVAKLLPAAAGLLVRKEIEALSKAVKDPERPYTVVLGGSKVSDKLGVIANLLTKADRLLIGGGMAYTFLAAQGNEVGASLLEKDQIDTVKGYLATAEQVDELARVMADTGRWTFPRARVIASGVVWPLMAAMCNWYDAGLDTDWRDHVTDVLARLKRTYTAQATGPA